MFESGDYFDLVIIDMYMLESIHTYGFADMLRIFPRVRYQHNDQQITAFHETPALYHLRSE